LQKEEAQANTELSLWQKKTLDERLLNYYSDTSKTEDFDKTIDDIEKNL